MTIENLENRRMFSRVVISAVGSTMSIVGTNRSDSIEIGVGQKSFVLNINGETKSISDPRVKHFRISGGSGSDTIILSPRLGIRATIDGGDGDDVIGGGGANDTLFGGR